MMTKLFGALYISLFASVFIMLFTSFAAGWIFFFFLFAAVFGGLLLSPRPAILATGFLLASLAVLWWGYFAHPLSERSWVALLDSGWMSLLSAYTLVWVLFKYKPAPPEPPAAPHPHEAAAPRVKLQPIRARTAAIKEKPLQALVCPGCGSADLEGSYPEYKCTYCGTRFVAPHAPPQSAGE
jgi:hypothetical protein